MSKLAELEKELMAVIEKYDVDEMCDTDAKILTEATTTYWGTIKTVKSSGNLEPKAN
jgi:hypothetical protein